MKKMLLITCLFYSTYSFASVPPVNIVRALYQKAVTDEKACKELAGLIAPSGAQNKPILMGYKASGTMMMAAHVFNPFTKLSYFRRGKQMLEKAISLDSTNVELRFLRFNVQTNTPSFLGYDDCIASDKWFIIGSLSALADVELKELLITTLNRSKYLTAAEKQQLK